MNILTFSPSTRKVWTDKRAVNPAYFLMATLVANLSEKYNVYSIDESFSPVQKMKKYKGEHIDCVISIGAIYTLSDTKKKLRFDPDYSRHKRIYTIAGITKDVFDKFDPLHINLCVDVSKWSQELTEMFGKAPNLYITEQEMKWQTYLYKHCLSHRFILSKSDDFFYAGGAKNRIDRFLTLTKGIEKRKLIAGGGWKGALSKENHYWSLGFINFPKCLAMCQSSKWSLVFQTHEGNIQNWITGRLFMNIATKMVGFIDKEYDKEGMYVPERSKLRVESDDEINYLMKSYTYEYLIAEQEKMIKSHWIQWETYTKPFEKKIRKLLR
jgi:hypothetical protein